MIENLAGLLQQFAPDVVKQQPGGSIKVSIPDAHPRAKELVKAFTFLQNEAGNDQRSVALFLTMLRDVVDDRQGFDAELRRIGATPPVPVFTAGLGKVLETMPSKDREWLGQAVDDNLKQAKIAPLSSSSSTPSPE